MLLLANPLIALLALMDIPVIKTYRNITVYYDDIKAVYSEDMYSCNRALPKV